MMPTWAIVATMDEPAPLVAAFAAYHLSAGAQEVHIYLDQADPESEALLAPLPGCRVTVCDTAYWAASPSGIRPDRHVNRQMHNAQRGYDVTTADWILHCDADEFIADATMLTQELAATHCSVQSLRLRMSERVTLVGQVPEHIFDGVFRMPFKEFEEKAADVFGHVTGFFRSGITGHKAGKSLVRTRAGLQMAIHGPRGKPKERKIESTRLLHFDGLTRLHYMIKLLRRANEPPGPASKRHGISRVTQFESLAESVADVEHRETLVTILKELTQPQADRLRNLKSLDDRGFDPRPALVAGGIDVDLTVANFDGYLRKRNAKFLLQVAPDLL